MRASDRRKGLILAYGGPECWRALLGLLTLSVGMCAVVEASDGSRMAVCMGTAGVASSNCAHSFGVQLGNPGRHLACMQSQRPELAASVYLRSQWGQEGTQAAGVLHS